MRFISTALNQHTDKRWVFLSSVKEVWNLSRVKQRVKRQLVIFVEENYSTDNIRTVLVLLRFVKTESCVPFCAVLMKPLVALQRRCKASAKAMKKTGACTLWRNHQKLGSFDWLWSLGWNHCRYTTRIVVWTNVGWYLTVFWLSRFLLGHEPARAAYLISVFLKK